MAPKVFRSLQWTGDLILDGRRTFDLDGGDGVDGVDPTKGGSEAFRGHGYLECG